jgi:hypothetical protein
MRLVVLLAVLLSGPAHAQTAFLEKREFSARAGVVRVKLAVSHSRPEAESPGAVLEDGVNITPKQFRIPPGKTRRLMLTFPSTVASRTPYFACVLYQPPVERMERGAAAGGSMLLATESCSRFWVNP